MKKKFVDVQQAFTITTTCERAAELSKVVGARVFWRPGGVVNWMLPELDAAQILEV